MTEARVDGLLPVASLDDALPYLRRPFTPEALKFKVQSVFNGNSGCLIVAYIDARLVIERLNLVCGGNWHADYAPMPDQPNAMLCGLTVFDQRRYDVGEGTGPQALKSRISDSLKRAAVHYGIGVSVYALKQARIYMSDAKGRIKLQGKAPKDTVVLTDQGLAWLRDGYRIWLDSQTNFGPPLDHGDMADAGGMEEESEAVEFVPTAPEPLNDERARDLYKKAELLYEEIDSKSYPPARFKAQLDGAAHSHEELERFVEFLRERAA